MTTRMTRHRFYIGEQVAEGTRYVSPEQWDRVEQWIASLAGGWTVYQVQGKWNGKQESSRVFEVIADPALLNTARRIAEKVRDLAEQTCVLWTHEECQGEFV